MSSSRYPLVLLVLVLAFWVWSGINVHDTRLTWVLETAPFAIALPVLLFTYRKFPLTNLVYTLIAIHAVILMVGGHYSYAKVPLGFWMEDWFGWTRNNYDKVGHFMQGFGPAIYVREVLVRTSPVKRGGWLAFFSVCVPLAFSVLYELLEWAASVANAADTEAFLGTQGYIWDTQSDMFMCLVGSIVALVLLSHVHDRALERMARGRYF